MQADGKKDDPYFHSYEFMQKIETQLASRFGMEDLHSGSHTIRNEKGWRENEKDIEYAWLVNIARSFVGWGTLFTIRLNEYKYREHSNPAELIQGLCIFNQAGISEIYYESVQDVTDQVAEAFTFNPFEANPGITLDGVSYNVRIRARNIDTFVQINNPQTAGWNKLEKLIWQKGKALAERSGNKEMISLFCPA